MTIYTTKTAATGRAISHLRELRAMTRSELATEADLARARIEAAEAGANVSRDTMAALALGLGTTPEHITQLAAYLDTASIVATFAQHVRELRETEGYSQEALARRSILHRTAISKIDRGLTDPRLSTIMRLSLGLGVPATTLVDFRVGEPQE